MRLLKSMFQQIIDLFVFQSIVSPLIGAIISNTACDYAATSPLDHPPRRGRFRKTTSRLTGAIRTKISTTIDSINAFIYPSGGEEFVLVYATVGGGSTNGIGPARH